ncbi:hypothetical protein AURANDRAFT_14899, partial [Aureococcus anophagefferens]
LHLAASEALAGMCEILLAEGADTNIQSTIDGAFSLHHAAQICSTACVRLLLRAGTDVNAREHNFLTPLHFASSKGRVDAAKLLIAAGANLEARDRQGTTPLRLA